MRGCWGRRRSVRSDTAFLAVYQAISNRDAERARTLMLEHLGFAEERSNLYLKKIKEGV